jgi:hypothetical protein
MEPNPAAAVPRSARAAGPGLVHRLADYLDRNGRYHPAGFCAAASGLVMPPTLAVCAATRLSAAGTPPLEATPRRFYLSNISRYLGHTPHYFSNDVRPVRWAIAQVSLDDPYTISRLLRRLREAGIQE